LKTVDKFANRIGVAALALLLAPGCVHYQPKPLAPTRTASNLQSRTLTDAGLMTFIETNAPGRVKNWPTEKWDFDRLTLAAFYYHPSLDVARAQWHVAQAGVKTAGGRPKPTLTVTPGYDVSALSGVNPWFPAVNFDIPIETAGKRAKRISVAEHVSESARLKIATTAWLVRSSVRSGLLNYVAVRHRAALLKEQVAAREQIVKLLDQKAHVGDIAVSELTISRVALAKARLDLTEARRQSAEARVNLAEAMGVSVKALDEVEVSFDLSSEPDAVNHLTSDEIQQQALLSRTDILGALDEYAAAEATLRLEIAKQYPDVHLNPGYQFDQGEHKWSLGISFDLPVFNRNQGPIAEAEARREEAAARFNELQAKVLAEIERTVEVFRVSESNSATLQSLSGDQEQPRASVEAQFKAGAVEQLDFLNAQLESAVSQLVLLDGHVKLQQAIGALEDAVQRPLDAITAPPSATFNPRQDSSLLDKEKEIKP
jgi:outer membrane protein, heavy metal efflux system